MSCVRNSCLLLRQCFWFLVFFRQCFPAWLGLSEHVSCGVCDGEFAVSSLDTLISVETDALDYPRGTTRWFYSHLALKTLVPAFKCVFAAVKLQSKLVSGDICGNAAVVMLNLFLSPSLSQPRMNNASGEGIYIWVTKTLISLPRRCVLVLAYQSTALRLGKKKNSKKT